MTKREEQSAMVGYTPDTPSGRGALFPKKLIVKTFSRMRRHVSHVHHMLALTTPKSG